MKDLRYPELKLTDDISLHIFELPKLEKLLKEKKHTGGMTEWLYFFNHAHEEVDEAMRDHYKNPAIFKAFGLLKTISVDKEIRRLAELREDALRNEASMLGEARREGVVGVALNMISTGAFSMELISQATKLSLDELWRLQGANQGVTP